MALNQVMSNTLTLSNPGVLPLTFSLGDRNIPPVCTLLNTPNNDFEAGDLTNWMVDDSVDANWFPNDGTYPRILDGATTSPVAGNFSALADQIGPGNNILYQDIPLPADLSGVTLLNWIDQWENHAGLFTDDQEFRVTLYGPGGTPFLGELFSTKPGDLTVSAPTDRTVDVTSLVAPYAGQTVRLQIEVETALFFFNIQVDEVQLCQDNVPWVTFLPAGGTIPPLSETTVEVVFNSNAVAQPGDYRAELLFSGNMANAVTPQPLIMHIPGPEDISDNIYLPLIRKN